VKAPINFFNFFQDNFIGNRHFALSLSPLIYIEPI
jgi:hypothetical protein